MATILGFPGWSLYAVLTVLVIAISSNLTLSMIASSDRKVSVSAETRTEYSAEYSADTECSVIF